jgi:hypothetical protein
MSGEWWMVIRVYRSKRRVLAMFATRLEAEARFEKERVILRDGDVVLAKATLDTISCRSGGYNRTRW